MAEYTGQDLSRCCQCGEPIGNLPKVQVHVFGSHAHCMGLKPSMHHVHKKCYAAYKTRWNESLEEAKGMIASAMVSMVERGEAAKRNAKRDDDDDEDEEETEEEE